MTLKYDQQVDSAYIYLRPGAKVARTFRLDDSRFVDVDADFVPVGVELLGVSRGVNTEGLPEREAIELLIGRRFPVYA